MPTYDLPASFDFNDPRVQKTIGAITAKNIRVTAAHVSQSRTLHFIAEWYAARYDGRFDFMRQMRDLILSDRDLSVNQMAGVINCLVHDASKCKTSKVEELPADLPAVESPRINYDSNGAVIEALQCQAFRCNLAAVREGFCADHAAKNLPDYNAIETAIITSANPPTDRYSQYAMGVITPIVKNGTYTVVLNERGDYRTLRVESAKHKPEGTQIVGFLSGPNNERDFTDFAWLSGDRIGIWPRFKHDSISAQALKVLAGATEDRRADMGTAYAIESGRCCRCGRELTVPASLLRGMGPECTKKAS